MFKKGSIPWNKGLTKETDERVEKYSNKGKPSGALGKHWKRLDQIGENNPAKRLDVRKKISESKLAENNPLWKGGLYSHFHEEAKKFFGKPVCEDCGISLEEYRLVHKKGFHMHCLTRDYTILQQFNWKCVCSRCHSRIHLEENK